MNIYSTIILNSYTNQSKYSLIFDAEINLSFLITFHFAGFNDMTPFSYTYHEKEGKGYYIHTEKGYGWIKVFFNDHSAMILKASIQNRHNKMIWVQIVQHGELVWPHELIQALGEGIEIAESIISR
jgi:hypothetical protein